MAEADTGGKRQHNNDGLVITEQWAMAAEAIKASGSGGQSPPIVAVCGPKNSGKSTFCKFLVNELLADYAEVAYLETDAGQPEFTPPGCLSLHLLQEPVLGPPHSHQQEPLRCHYFGDLSPKADPEAYLRQIVSLYDHFRSHVYSPPATSAGSPADTRAALPQPPGVPLVMNTCGWIKGLGYDVLVDVLAYVVPTHVVQLRLPTAAKNLPPGAFWEPLPPPPPPGGPPSLGGSRAHLLFCDAVPAADVDLGRVAEKSAVEGRALRHLASIQSIVGRQPGADGGEADADAEAYAWAARALAAHHPYEVPLGAVSIVHLHSQIPAEEVLYSINGAVVGLAEAAGGSAGEPGRGLAGPPWCLGTGLVRGVDGEGGVLYLLTALPLARLQRVGTLLRGRIELPAALLQAPGLVSPYLSRFCIPAEGTGAAAMKSRGNLLRRTVEA